jgi:hypothetical protein
MNDTGVPESVRASAHNAGVTAVGTPDYIIEKVPLSCRTACRNKPLRVSDIAQKCAASEGQGRERRSTPSLFLCSPRSVVCARACLQRASVHLLPFPLVVVLRLRPCMHPWLRFSMLTGGIGAVIAKTVVAPLDRIKILNQTGGCEGGIAGAFRAVLAQDGVAGVYDFVAIATCKRSSAATSPPHIWYQHGGKEPRTRPCFGVRSAHASQIHQSILHP